MREHPECHFWQSPRVGNLEELAISKSKTQATADFGIGTTSRPFKTSMAAMTPPLR
jgi:hypothetical protein